MSGRLNLREMQPHIDTQIITQKGPSGTISLKIISEYVIKVLEGKQN